MRRQHLLPLVISAVLFILYLVLATSDGRSIGAYKEPYGKFAKQAYVLLEGRLNVGTAQPELLALPDPYDPQLNEPYRLCCFHDEALYESKIFLVHNIGPVLFLHLPFRLLTGEFLNPRLSVFLSSTLASVFMSCLILELLSRQRVLRQRERVCIAVLASVASPLTWLVSIGRDYEEAIALGQAFLLAGLLVLLRSDYHEAQRRWSQGIFLGFFLIGLAGLTRPVLYLAAPVMLAYAELNRNSSRKWKPPLEALVALSSVGIVQASYNYFRFENIFEFGTRFQLAGQNMRTYPINSLSHLVPNINDYLFKFPQPHWNFPWLTLSKNTFSIDPSIHYSEPMVGLVFIAPHIVLMASAFWSAMFIAIRGRLGEVERVPLETKFLLTLGLILLAAVSLPFNASTFRYSIDFAPIMVIGMFGTLGATRLCRFTWLRMSLLLLVAIAAANMTGLASLPCSGTGSC